jgi:hypothetical protein
MKTNITTIFTLFLFLAFPICSNGQNIWLDAKKLNEYLEFNPGRMRLELDESVEIDTAEFLSIIANYCPDAIVEDGNKKRILLDSCFKGNPFISLHEYAQSLSKNLLPASFRPSTEGGAPGAKTPTNGSLSGGNFVTKLADGLAIFLVKRTKEELNAAFFEGLRKKMDEEPTYQILFPATFDLIYVIGTEIYNYNAYIESLRVSFQKDLKVLPMNLKQYSRDYLFVKKPELQIAVEDLLGTSQMIFDAQEPLQILDFWAGAAAIQDSIRWKDISNDKTRKAMRDMATSMRMLWLFTNSLSQRGASTEWVTPEEVSREMRDISHVYLYLGLLWEQGKDLQFSNGTDFREALGKLGTMTQTPIALRNALVSLVQNARDMERMFKELVAGADLANITLNEEYLRFATQVFDMLKQAKNLRHQIILPDWKVEEDGKPTGQPKTDAQSAQTDTLEHKLFTVLHQFFDLEFNVRQERYTLAVANLTRVLTELLNKDDFKFKKEFLRHVNFMATMAEAQTSEEMAEAIELFALPPGSSRMKKQSDWSISLNSYGGLGYGKEHDFEKVLRDSLGGKSVFAPYAPVGIDFNLGLKNAGSLSLYAQLIDVGAVFAYRFSDETSQIPELKFQNIVAPGGYFIYGFGNNIPTSIGIGAQLGPNLRKIKPDPGTGTPITEKTTNAWRFGIIFSVDIPITHFYTR